MNWLLKINNSTYFWALCIISGLFAFLFKQFLYTDQLFYATLSEQFTFDQIQNVLAYQNTSWRKIIGYCLIPAIIIIRVLYTSFCLYIGNLVNENHWKYKSVYTIALKSDIAFGLGQICNFYYYYFFQNVTNLNELGISCFSLLKIVGKEAIPNWLAFAFNSINVFELLYIVLLILFIHTISKLSYLKSTVFVVLTYLVGNYFYIIVITFLYLSYL